MNLDSLQADQVEQVFARHGAQSVTLSDAGDNPVLEPAPGDTPLWADTKISGLFSAEVDLKALQEDLLHAFGLDRLPEAEIESLEDCAWEREWLKDFRPMRFGERLWVSPLHIPVAQQDAIVVRLDPGLAFGTGTHETTALCLEWIERQDLHGKRVLDIGCGSGILSIAALLLGAKSAHAVDIDPQAITASKQNATVNGVIERLELSTDARDFAGEYDIVVANILAGTLIGMAGDLSKRTMHGGLLALSGILSGQIDDVCSAFVHWITLDPAVQRNNWARISGTRH